MTLPGSAQTTWVRVGIGEFAVSDRPEETIITAALGSCVAVCLWDAAVGVAGMLHFLLPDVRSNPVRAKEEPAAFADSGIPLLFRAAYDKGAVKKRCDIWLIGGADMIGNTQHDVVNMGQRNVLAARSILWRNGIMIRGEAVGGNSPRTVTLAVADGHITVKADGRVVSDL
jgi:chemotaxis protein CheD